MKFREPSGISQPPPAPTRTPSRKKFKVKIKLPNSIIESIIREGDDVAVVARDIAMEHHLSPLFEAKIMTQLQAVLAASKK